MAWTVLFEDDFEGMANNDPFLPRAGWSSTLGNWLAFDLNVGGPHEQVIIYPQNPGSLLTYAAGVDDMRMTATPKPVSGFIGGIMTGHADENNFVLWEVVMPENAIKLYIRQGGLYTLLDEVSFTFTPETFYELQLELVGTSAKGYVNGVLLSEQTLTGPQRASLGQGAGIYTTGSIQINVGWIEIATPQGVNVRNTVGTISLTLASAGAPTKTVSVSGSISL